jgi:hypothetical protein
VLVDTPPACCFYRVNGDFDLDCFLHGSALEGPDSSWYSVDGGPACFSTTSILVSMSVMVR